jgi:nucleotide-binding universal stress UspA family protein
MSHLVGVLIAIGFLTTLSVTLIRMLRLPRSLSHEAARAVYSVEATRCIIVPILDLFYTERATELACRLGRRQHALIVLAYIVEVPRLLILEAPLPPEVEERAKKALAHAKSIVERHNLKAVTTTVRTREVDEGIRRAVNTYHGDIVFLGMQVIESKVPGVFTRTASALLQHPPCEVLIDSMVS